MMTTPAVAPTCTTGLGPAVRSSAHTVHARTLTNRSARLSSGFVNRCSPGDQEAPNQTALAANPSQLQCSQAEQRDPKGNVPCDQTLRLSARITESGLGCKQDQHRGDNQLRLAAHLLEDGACDQDSLEGKHCVADHAVKRDRRLEGYVLPSQGRLSQHADEYERCQCDLDHASRSDGGDSVWLRYIACDIHQATLPARRPNISVRVLGRAETPR